MNPTLDTLLHRNSLRPNQMQEPAPSDAELQTILRAATRVSDHGNLNPWRLDVYRKPARCSPPTKKPSPRSKPSGKKSPRCKKRP